MRVHLHRNQDLFAGLLFLILGVAGLALGRAYPVGSSLSMGPGYFPTLLCWCLIVLGGGIAIRGALTASKDPLRWHFRPMLLVPASIAVFGLAIEPGGLPAAVFLCVLVGALSGLEFRLREVVILAVGLAIVGVGIFVYGLGLPMKVTPF